MQFNFNPIIPRGAEWGAESGDNKLLVTGEQEQAELVTIYLEKLLAPNKNKQVKRYPSSKMETPYTVKEIKKVYSGMQNGKAVGINEFRAEFIKYADVKIHNVLADIYNITAETGDYPKEINTGIILRDIFSLCSSIRGTIGNMGTFQKLVMATEE